MRVTIAGSSGLIGTALVASLRADGHECAGWCVGPPPVGTSPDGTPDRGSSTRVLADADAVVNLCGVGFGDNRWTGALQAGDA